MAKVLVSFPAKFLAEMDRVIATVVATREQVERGALAASPLLVCVKREGVRP